MCDQNSKILICDGELEIVKITENFYDQAVKLYQDYFMKYENVSIATNLLGSQHSIDEMEMLIRAILKDGISFAAKKTNSNELVAMCCNKILNPSTNCSLDEVFSKFTSPSMLSVGNYLHRMEGTYDLHKEWNIDCLFEIVFLSTHTDYVGRGLATILSQHAIEYARQMSAGTLPATEILPAHIRDQRPKAVCAVFTSKFSQRVGEKLGFQVVNQVPNSEFVFEGKTFAEKIDPIHKFSTFVALRL